MCRLAQVRTGTDADWHVCGPPHARTDTCSNLRKAVDTQKSQPASFREEFTRSCHEVVGVIEFLNTYFKKYKLLFRFSGVL